MKQPRVTRKEFQEQAKKSEIPVVPQEGVPQEHQAKQPHVYAEDLAQSYAGSVITASDSVSPYTLYLVDSMGHVLLLSLILLVPTILPPHLHQRSLSFT